MPSSNAAAEPLLRRIASVSAPLALEDREALLGLPVEVREVSGRQTIVREGDRPRRSCMILEGFACASKTTLSGSRQILAFYLLGDVPDLQSLHLSVMDSSIETITQCQLGFVQHRDLLELCELHPKLAGVLWRLTLIDAAIFREWITNIGQRPAYGRIAHVLAETFLRLQVMGLVEDDACVFPLSQHQLAEATGMSTVHVNRSLQELRSSGVISLHGGLLKVTDWPKLEEIADFDPAYLHLKQ